MSTINDRLQAIREDVTLIDASLRGFPDAEEEYAVTANDLLKAFATAIARIQHELHWIETAVDRADVGTTPALTDDDDEQLAEPTNQNHQQQMRRDAANRRLAHW